EDGNRRLVWKRKLRAFGGRYLCVCRKGFRCLDLCREHEPVAWNGFDQDLVFAAFADCFTRRIDPAVESRVGNDSTFPDVLDQLVLTDHAVGILGKVEEQIEHLRFDMDCSAPTFKLAPAGIESKIIEL